MLLTPLKITRHLDKSVIGQARAKRDLALCAWKKWLGGGAHTGARFAQVQGAQGPHTILLIGPTGSGKSFLLRQLARLFGSDVLFFSATSLVQTGYVGLSIDNLLQEAYERCHYDKERTESCILAIDEVDKIRCSHSRGPDVSGAGVQQALLTVFDGRPATVKHPRGREVIDTSGMMFVCAGAFVGLEDIVAKRLSVANAVGFGKKRKQSGPVGIAETRTEDLIQFGMIPEFIGRFATISFLEELSAGDLANVLSQGKDSVVKQKQQLFASLGVDLTFEDTGLAALAEEAKRLRIGARGLTRVVNQVLAQDEFELPYLAKRGVSELVVTEATVRRRARAKQVKKPIGPIRRKKSSSRQPVLPIQVQREEEESPI